MIRAFASWLGRVFGPKGDDYKSLLMADLGLKR